MKIGFFCVYRGDPIHYVLADIMIRSANLHMPGVEIHQLTDDKSPLVVGATGALRKQGVKMAALRAAHQVDCKGDWLFVDTDIVFQKDVRHVFDDLDFDVAVADRNWPHDPLANSDSAVAKQMPHNVGVVFSRNPQFFATVQHLMKILPPDKQGWLGDQYAACYAIQSGAYRVKVLPGMEYNCPPDERDTPMPDAAILHYKGPRKGLMLKRIVPLPAPVGEAESAQAA